MAPGVRVRNTTQEEAMHTLGPHSCINPMTAVAVVVAEGRNSLLNYRSRGGLATKELLTAVAEVWAFAIAQWCRGA